ncbi:uncharacterized protein B0H18DRAFT_1125885 [Fomitopsis serialis]|uniref:uncharacterized protein n=1 Tax=Fomitopsis serialis TaxID=139415 RepID=UPI002007674F|nr:uncharacterized protein B0H18DRAFT_1125885 [Neoantrodia serialis]KAH9914023.1 hypothetical protein B0H18DRAFT_1125885 [Neoantrodia serialis]
MVLLAFGTSLFLARFALLQVHGSQTFWPLAVPLAVRTPYLNTWMYKTKTSDSLNNQLPSFFDTEQDIGWNCYIRVDGKTYIVFGDNNFPPNYTVAVGSLVQTELSPTRTMQTIEAGPLNITLTFLSPIDPSDLIRQSSRSAMLPDWPVFPISVDLGSVASLDSPVVWVIGHVRDPSISYTLSGKPESLRPYYTTQYSTTEDALEFFVSDFNTSLTQANLLDTQVRGAASSISVDGKLHDMLSLATRQAFSSLEITAPHGSDGTTRIFMKDMGTSQRVTPVEKLYAALPMFLYYNASLVKPLLVPLLEQQNTSLGAFPYASKDLGSSFPEVSGPNLTSTEAVEQSGNMLLIALAHAKYANDTSLIHDYYPLLRNWAEYLTQHGQFPKDQSSVDDGSDATNSTNLAVKGIFAIQAMAEISQIVGESDDSQHFSASDLLSSNYMNTWESLAISSGGASASVNQTFGSEITGIWSLPYNLYAQTLFGFNLLNQTWLDKLTVMYGQWIQPETANYRYGLPMQSVAQSLGNVAWNAFIAATCTNDTVRSQLLDAVWNYASFNGTSAPFGAVYNVESGAYQDGMASPALGGLFAPFLRSGTVTVFQTPSPPSNSTTSPTAPSASGSGGNKVDVSAVAGGVVGGVVGLLALAGLVLWLVRRHRNQKNAALFDTTGTRTEPAPFEAAPAFAAQAPGIILTEKQRRELESPREETPVLPSAGSSSAIPLDEPPSEGTMVPSSANGVSVGSRENELLGLHSMIEELRRITGMLNVHIESAPPEYTYS